MSYPHFSVDCRDYHDLVVDFKVKPRPLIVCLCGSTRFYEEYQKANFEFTMHGYIVLTVGFYPHADVHGQQVGIGKAEKGVLDELHKRKIDLADRVYVINKGGYIGDSTRSEIVYAKSLNKRIEYMEDL